MATVRGATMAVTVYMDAREDCTVCVDVPTTPATLAKDVVAHAHRAFPALAHTEAQVRCLRRFVNDLLLLVSALSCD